MRNILTAATFLVLGAGFASQAYADEAAHTQDSQAAAEERVEHYQAEKLETVNEAFKALDEKVAEIATIVAQDNELDITELEDIHEASYTLEAAVDKIREEKAADVAQIDALDEAVQALHFASENQEEGKTREWFAKLKTTATDIKVSDVKPAAGDATADVMPEEKEFYEIVIKDHKFSPEELVVPAGQKIKLIVDNQDPTPEEFESHDMNREKIIAGNKKATIFIGPLNPGKYHYFGEFNMDSANGYIIAK